MPVPSLPPEIVSSIIKQVDDPAGRDARDRIWFNCALVSKTFLHLTRKALYHNISFELKEKYEDDPPRTASLDARSQLLFNTLVAAPNLAAHVRTLFFIGFGLTELATFENMLETILDMAKDLKSLSLGVCVEVGWAARQRSEVLAGLIRRFAATLRLLHLPERYVHSEDLFPFLSSLPALTSLDLHDFGIVARDLKIPDSSFRLRRLYAYDAMETEVLEKLLRTSQNSLAELICDWVLEGQTFNLAPFVALRSLHVNIPYDNQDHARKLLDAIQGCPNLRELHTSHRDPDDDEFELGDAVVAIDELRPFHRLPPSLRGITMYRSLSIRTTYLLEFLADGRCLPNLEFLQLEPEVRANDEERMARTEEEMLAIKAVTRTSGIFLCKCDAEDWFDGWWEDEFEGESERDEAEVEEGDDGQMEGEDYTEAR